MTITLNRFVQQLHVDITQVSRMMTVAPKTNSSIVAIAIDIPVA